MTPAFVQAVWTVIAFVFFVGVVIWAWSSARKKDFEEAANLPLDEERFTEPDKQE